MHNYQLQNKFVLQATVTGTFQMKTWRDKAVPICNFTLFASGVIMHRKKEGVCVSRAKRAGVAFRSMLLLYFSHWVPWICLIQQSQLVYSHCGVMGTCELQWKEMWRWEAPSWRGRSLSFGALRARIKPISARVMMIWKEKKGFAEKQKKNPGCDIINTLERARTLSATSDISNRSAHSGAERASKSNDYMAKIIMWLVQLHTISPDCPLQSGWLIVFYTDLRISRGSQRWDKLRQHKETDILSGPRTAIVILWRCSGCQVGRGSNREKSVWGTLVGKNATWHFSKWTENLLVFERSCHPELYHRYSQFSSQDKRCWVIMLR